MKEGRRVSSLNVALIVAIVLSLITLIATAASGNWSVRHIYNLFFFTFFNFTVLSLNVWVFTREKSLLHDTVRHLLRKAFIVAYCAVYIAATIGFVSTGQITRVQTILFLSVMHPISTMLVAGTIVLIAAILFVVLLHKKMPIHKASSAHMKKVRVIFLVNLILLIITVFVNLAFLQIEDPLITDTGELVIYQMPEESLQNRVLNVDFELEKPNVVFVMLESVSAEKLGFYGYERETSPNIDKLLEKSVVFKEAYTTSSHSDYAQTGVLSSRYMFANDYRNLFTYDNPRKFVWDMFNGDGYITGYFSSQDDRWEGMNKYYDFSGLDNYTYSMTDGEFDYGTGFEQKDYDYRTADRAIDWLNYTADKEEPFFLYLNFQATHNPLVYPKNYSYFTPDEVTDLKLFTLGGENVINRYDNSLRYVDSQVGRVIDFLDEKNISNNTVIVLLADHGHDLQNRHDVNGHGNSIYNDEITIPLAFYLPGVEHSEINERVSSIDVVPTLIDLLGYEIPREFQGKVMIKGAPLYSVTQSNKYLISMIFNDTKTILDINRELVEVYNIGTDKNELNNLYTRGKYTNEMLRLLFWSYCQRDYYAKERWNGKLNNRCSINNNFKI